MTHMIKPFTLTRTTYTFLFATASLCLAVLITINVPPFIGMPVEAKELAVFPAPIALPAEDLAAKAAVLYDPTTGQILFAKNATEPLALASLTKLMTAQTILAQTSERQIVTITSQNLRPEGDWGLRPGEMWSVEQLLRFGLVASANDAMAAAADAIASFAEATRPKRSNCSTDHISPGRSPQSPSGRKFCEVIVTICRSLVCAKMVCAVISFVRDARASGSVAFFANKIWPVVGS